MGRPKLIKVDVTDGRGLGGAKKKTVTVQRRIPDILAFRDTPIFAYLLLAANPNTPVSVLRMVLEAVGPHQAHPEKWMYERRQLVQKPSMPRGIDERVVSFVAANMCVPPWQIRVQLRKQGIKISVAKLYRIRMCVSYQTAMDSDG
ncbi:MAG: hypothetical protein RB191_20510 [Terriglobia bacterium]|nr:hypothetical protein [Terriglobia bacterium]